MARKTGVLAAHQNTWEQPRSLVPKCVAELMVRRLEADKVGPHLIRRRRMDATARAHQPRCQARTQTPAVDLSMGEIPGLKFVGPKWAGLFAPDEPDVVSWPAAYDLRENNA